MPCCACRNAHVRLTIADLRAGVIERLRVTPVSRLAMPLGRALRDVVVLLVQSILLVLVAWPLGLTADLGGVAIALGLLILMGLLMASCSYALALALKTQEEGFQPGGGPGRKIQAHVGSAG